MSAFTLKTVTNHTVSYLLSILNTCRFSLPIIPCSPISGHQQICLVFHQCALRLQHCRDSKINVNTLRTGCGTHVLMGEQASKTPKTQGMVVRPKV